MGLWDTGFGLGWASGFLFCTSIAFGSTFILVYGVEFGRSAYDVLRIRPSYLIIRHPGDHITINDVS